MQKFLDFISSKSFRNVMCFILFTFLMSVTISSQNYFFQKVIENGISKKDIVAQKDIKVIDTAASTIKRAPSTIPKTRSTSPPKSACPGVSTTLIFVPL